MGSNFGGIFLLKIKWKYLQFSLDFLLIYSPYPISLVGHQFGRVEFRTFVYIFSTTLVCMKQQLIFEIRHFQINELSRTYISSIVIISDAGRWKTLGVPVVIGGNNLPSPVGIGLTDLLNIGGGAVALLAPRFRHHWLLLLPVYSHSYPIS